MEPLSSEYGTCTTVKARFQPWLSGDLLRCCLFDRKRQGEADDITVPHGGVRPFYQKSSCRTQSSLGTFVVQSRPNYPLELRGNETLVLHHAARPLPTEKATS